MPLRAASASSFAHRASKRTWHSGRLQAAQRKTSAGACGRSRSMGLSWPCGSTKSSGAHTMPPCCCCCCCCCAAAAAGGGAPALPLPPCCWGAAAASPTTAACSLGAGRCCWGCWALARPLGWRAGRGALPPAALPLHWQPAEAAAVRCSMLAGRAVTAAAGRATGLGPAASCSAVSRRDDLQARAAIAPRSIGALQATRPIGRTGHGAGLKTAWPSVPPHPTTVADQQRQCPSSRAT